jgi:hypothetical protein
MYIVFTHGFSTLLSALLNRHGGGGIFLYNSHLDLLNTLFGHCLRFAFPDNGNVGRGIFCAVGALHVGALRAMPLPDYQQTNKRQSTWFN